jgi:hypothetical protein
MSKTWGRQVFPPFNSITQFVSWWTLQERIFAGTKNDFGFLQRNCIFLMPSEEILSVNFCSFSDCSYFGHILTKNEDSAPLLCYLLLRPQLQLCLIHPFTNHD